MIRILSQSFPSTFMLPKLVKNEFEIELWMRKKYPKQRSATDGVQAINGSRKASIDNRQRPHIYPNLLLLDRERSQ